MGIHIVHSAHDNRNVGGGLMSSPDALGTRGHNHVHAATHQFGGERRQPIQPTLCGQYVERNGLTLDVANIPETLRQVTQILRPRGI